MGGCEWSLPRRSRERSERWRRRVRGCQQRHRERQDDRDPRASPAGLKPGGYCGSRHRFRISNHKKNGPPMMAVMMPTGNSIGANTVRAMTSQTTRNAAPKNVDAGSTNR